MKIEEYNHPDKPWIDRLLNAWPFCLHVEQIRPLFAFGVCKNEDDEWQWWSAVGKDKTTSLFYNGAFYMRIMAPFWIGIHIRWAGKDQTKNEYFQCGLGWKLNGRIAPLFRIQSDDSSEQGTHGPNAGQAKGWNCGTK